MCMFCAALPMVLGVTAAAQGEQRKRMQQVQAHKPQERQAAAGVLASERQAVRPIIPRKPMPLRLGAILLSPRQITALGALTFVGLLMASAFYHANVST